MQTWYLDLETTGLDPYRERILTIQTHRIEDGRGVGRTTVHKAWAHPDGEAGILRTFLEETQFFREPWTFVPVGYNLGFELKWLFAKAKQYGLLPAHSRFEAVEKPRIDVRDVAVMMNGGRLKGAKLENFSPKMGSGDLVAKAIASEDHESIEAYVEQETAAFLQLYEALVEELPRAWRERIAPRIGVDPDDPAPYRRAPDPAGALRTALGGVRIGGEGGMAAEHRGRGDERVPDAVAQQAMEAGGVGRAPSDAVEEEA